jgi:Flp pilus assembly protein TadB
MVVQRLAPWASLLASALTLVYVTIREWRRLTQGDTAGGDRSLARLASRLDTFVYTALAALFVAAVLHILLLLTPVSFLVVPVWLLAVFVVLSTGATQAMPGDSFEEKLELADEELRADSNATATQPADASGEPVLRPSDGESDDE